MTKRSPWFEDTNANSRVAVGAFGAEIACIKQQPHTERVEGPAHDRAGWLAETKGNRNEAG
jgi:hypothetical protein